MILYRVLPSLSFLSLLLPESCRSSPIFIHNLAIKPKMSFIYSSFFLVYMCLCGCLIGSKMNNVIIGRLEKMVPNHKTRLYKLCLRGWDNRESIKTQNFYTLNNLITTNIDVKSN